MIECITFSQPGAYHRERGQDNEDFVTTACTDSVAVCVLCDGAGGLKAGGIAAKLVSQSIADVLLRDFSELYASDGNCAGRKIVLQVYRSLTGYSLAAGIPASDLGCTILAAAMDREGRCISFHLGDGIILRHRQYQSHWQVVSAPRNGLWENSTYLTMNCDMLRQIHFCRWKDPQLHRLLLLTDGAAEHLTHRSGKDGWVLPHPPDTAPETLRRYLDKRSPMDDYSLGMLIRTCPEAHPCAILTV